MNGEKWSVYHKGKLIAELDNEPEHLETIEFNGKQLDIFEIYEIARVAFAR